MLVNLRSLHHQPHPALVALTRRGVGAGPSGAATCDQYLADAFATLPSTSIALALLNTAGPNDMILGSLYIMPGPGNSASAQAQATLANLASEYCTAAAYEASENDPSSPANPNCSNNALSCINAALPTWTAYYSALPPQVFTSGYTGQAVITGAAPVPAPSPVNNTPTSVLPGYTAANLQNLSNPNAAGGMFAVGDNFRLTISGAANSPVSEVSAYQNGSFSGSNAAAGTTDASGNLVITGTFATQHVGTWQETWQIGNGIPTTIYFTVAAVPSPSNPSSSNVPQSAINTGSNSSTSSGGSSSSSNSSSTSSGSSSTDPFAWFTESAVGGVPNYVLVAGGLVLLMMLPSLIGGRR